MQVSRGRAAVASALPEEAQALRGMLERAGFSDVICVSDGLSAVRQAQRAMTDVIVADAVLPVLDGRAMAERLASLPLSVYPAVVLLSATGICPESAGCALKKPVREAELTAAIDALAVHLRSIPEGKRLCALSTLERLGVPDEFAKLGYADVLYKYYGYDAQGIAETLKKLLNT